MTGVRNVPGRQPGTCNRMPVVPHADVLPVGPALGGAQRMQLLTAAGRWHRQVYQRIPAAAVDNLDGIITAVYLWTDDQRRIRWLGKACRDGGVLARLHEHLSRPERAAVFRHVHVLRLDDHTPESTVFAIEGRCADLLGLRGTMPGRSWPSAHRWDELVH